LQAIKASKFEDRYENALVELLNQKRKREAGTNGRENRAIPATSST
jgi:non-homologous end joining protein Ku